MYETVVLKDKYDDHGSLKKTKIYQSICLNFSSFDTIEAAILDWRNLLANFMAKTYFRIWDANIRYLEVSWKSIEHWSFAPR